MSILYVLIPLALVLLGLPLWLIFAARKLVRRVMNRIVPPPPAE